VFSKHNLKSKANFLKDLNDPEVAVVFKQFKFLADSLKMGVEMDFVLLAKVTAVISRDSGPYKRDITLDLNSKVQKYFEGIVLHNDKALDCFTMETQFTMTPLYLTVELKMELKFT